MLQLTFTTHLIIYYEMNYLPTLRQTHSERGNVITTTTQEKKTRIHPQPPRPASGPELGAETRINIITDTIYVVQSRLNIK